jgi:leucine dehydrogenase
VTSISPSGEIEEDPSLSTAQSVFRAIQAAIKFKFKKENCDGIRVAIQGVGRVGYNLAKKLVAHGAIVIISDANHAIAEKCAKELNVAVVSVDQIETVDCDIYSPCAMGGTITLDFIHHTKAKIIGGAANNQLAHHNNTHVMHERGIIYLPDFLINSGGLIHVAMGYAYQDTSKSHEKVNNVYDITMTMLERAAHSGKTTTVVAEEMAYEKLK